MLVSAARAGFSYLLLHSPSFDVQFSEGLTGEVRISIWATSAVPGQTAMRSSMFTSKIPEAHRRCRRNTRVLAGAEIVLEFYPFLVAMAPEQQIWKSDKQCTPLGVSNSSFIPMAKLPHLSIHFTFGASGRIDRDPIDMDHVSACKLAIKPTG